MTFLTWHREAWNDYLYCQKVDKRIFDKINKLIKECLRSPFDGLGTPEPLVGNYTGYWSRRINKEHRLVYKVDDNMITIASCLYHY